jgi:valyl-tRNA synthetase
MSKSKGNVIDPLGIVQEQGADALRMSLVFGTGAGNDIIVSEDKVIAQKRFANKLWQASKFVLINLGNPPTGGFDLKKVKKPRYSKTDKWILKELQKTVKKITRDIDQFRFHEAAQEIYQFFWHKFCDKTIEDVKRRIKEKARDADNGKLVLLTVLLNSLKLLHPFMPFITEEIYQKLPIKNRKKFLMIENWPK